MVMRESTGWLRHVLRCALVLLPLIGWAYFTWADPRPYFIAEDDPEHLTFYSARLVEAGAFPLLDVHNPGLTTTYIAASARFLGGGQLDSPASLFPWLRLLTAILTGFALYLIARFSLARMPPGFVALALALVVAWPSFLLFFDYFDPIAMQTPIGLITVALCWRALTAQTLTRGRIVACGLALGVCLATKFTFIPLAVAMGAVTAVAVQGGVLRQLQLLSLLVGTTLATLGVIGLPAFGDVSAALATTLVSRSGSPEWAPAEWFTLVKGFIALNTPAGATLLGGVVVYVAQLLTSRTSDRPPDRADAFLLLMLAALVYTVGASDGINARGLRLAQPTALCLPFLVLRVLERARDLRPALRSPAAQAVAGLLALWIVVPAWVDRIQERSAFVHAQKVRAEDTRARLLSLTRPGTRAAVWDGSPGFLIGEESFHFWGNYAYARNYFDAAVLREYPHFAHLRLHDAVAIAGRAADASEGSREEAPRVPGSAFGWPGRLWRRLFPRQEIYRLDELVSGTPSAPQVSLITLPHSELWEFEDVSGDPMEALMPLVEARFGPAVHRQEIIAGINWIVIEVANVAAAATFRP
jgi:hypothetical protein